MKDISRPSSNVDNNSIEEDDLDADIIDSSRGIGRRLFRAE